MTSGIWGSPRALGHPQPVAPLEASQMDAPHTPDERAMLAELLEKFTALPGMLRQSITDQMWAQIPYHVIEENHTVPGAQLAIGTPLPVQPMTQNLEQIQTVTASVPAGATGMVQLGSYVLYLPTAGLYSVGGLHLLLDSAAARSLTLAGAAGPASLMLTGMRAMTFGQNPS